VNNFVQNLLAGSGVTFQAASMFEWQREKSLLRYIAYIDNNSSAVNEYKPDSEYPTGYAVLNNFVQSNVLPGGFVSNEIPPNTTDQKNDISLREIATMLNFDLANRPQLYLHIYPLSTQSYTKVVTSKYDPPFLGITSKWLVQGAINIPISWN